MPAKSPRGVRSRFSDDDRNHPVGTKHIITAKLITAFLKYLEAERRRSPNTVSSYRRDLEQFLGFLGVGEDDFDPSAVTADDVREWIISLTGAGMKATSVNRMISAVNSFYAYLMRQGAVAKNPMLKISQLKTPSNLPTYIPESKMERIVGELAAGNESGESAFVSERNALMVLFLYCTGIRLAELISIDRDDFDNGYSRLVVTGKGDKERAIPVIPLLKDKILLHIALIKRENICRSGEKALFLTERGSRISRMEVYRVIERQLRLMGVQGKRSPHVLRHTFATHLLNNGADIREIQELLGHTSLNATQVYTHNSIAKLKEVYNDAHPRARNNKKVSYER